MMALVKEIVKAMFYGLVWVLMLLLCAAEPARAYATADNSWSWAVLLHPGMTLVVVALWWFFRRERG